MFIDETREHLQAWSDGIMKMEKDDDSDTVAVLFRAAHTIKGMAMTMGYTRMGQITHTAENLLDGVRQGTLPISPALVTALLRALDVLEVLLTSIEQSGQEEAIDTAQILQELNGVHTALQTTAPHATSPLAKAIPHMDAQQELIAKVADQAIALGYSVYEIQIGFASDCVMPMARFAQWLQRIDQNLLLHTTPDAVALESGNYSGDISVIIASSQDFEQVGHTLSDISEVIVRSISVWLQGDPAHNAVSTDLLPPGDKHITEDEHVMHVITQALQQGIHVYEVGILLAEACQMKSVRSFILFNVIGGQNHLLYTDPQIQQIEQEQMDRRILFVMWSQDDVQQVQQALLSVSEIDLLEIRQWSQTADPTVVRDSQILSQGKVGTDLGERKRVNTIRVDTEKLDDLMNLVSELAIDKTRLERIRTEVAHAGLTETVDHMSRLSSQLQELIMSIRMVPVETVFHRFPRMVRDTAQQLGKEVDFILTGQETELDRTVIEEIGDPIMHMLRNSLDHGLEVTHERIACGKPAQGRIELRAYAAGNHVFIEVEDDGAGINRDKVLHKAVERGLVTSSEELSDYQVYQLLFASGFTTAEQVSDLSGRGVGLDVVKAKIEALSGKIDIYSEVGKGSRFVIRLPMTLAIMDGLMVRIGSHPYLIPIGSIAETGLVKHLKTVHGKEVVVWRDRVVPIVRAKTVFGEADQDISDELGYVVFVSRGDKFVGIIVDELIGQFEVVLKSLDQQLKKIPYFAGATILGDGEVSLIIDANSFIE